LTDEKLRLTRELLAKLEVGGDAPAPLNVPAAEIEKAQRAQRDSLEGLRDWFNDWATTLRQVFNVKAQLQLGLTTAKQRSAAADDTEDEGEDAEDEDAEDDDSEGGDAEDDDNDGAAEENAEDED
jgi:hypothetical protein